MCGAPDRLSNGYLLPLVAYTLFSVNLDFWEYFWLANGKAKPVFFYSAGRLAVRVLVVVVTAALTRDFHAVIWALVGLEGTRLVIAGICMTNIFDRSPRRASPALREPWRDQTAILPAFGRSHSLLAMANRNVSNVIVARTLGAVSLAQYAIGRFGEPVVTTVRNSVSAVILPEMVRKDRGGAAAGGTALALWQKATVVNTIMLFPIVVLVARYAEPLVTWVFGPSYVSAAQVMQIYMLVVIRECFDFAPALRAVNRTRPLVESNVAGLHHLHRGHVVAHSGRGTSGSDAGVRDRELCRRELAGLAHGAVVWCDRPRAAAVAEHCQDGGRRRPSPLC